MKRCRFCGSEPVFCSWYPGNLWLGCPKTGEELALFKTADATECVLHENNVFKTDINTNDERKAAIQELIKSWNAAN